MASSHSNKFFNDLKTILERQDKQLEKLNELSIALAKNESLFHAHLEQFDAHVKQDEKIYDQLVDTTQKISELNEKMGEYNHQLKIHIAGVEELKRTNALLEAKLDTSTQKLSDRIAKNELFIQAIKNIKYFLFKLLGVLATLTTIATLFKKYF